MKKIFSLAAVVMALSMLFVSCDPVDGNPTGNDYGTEITAEKKQELTADKSWAIGTWKGKWVTYNVTCVIPEEMKAFLEASGTTEEELLEEFSEKPALADIVITEENVDEELSDLIDGSVSEEIAGSTTTKMYINDAKTVLTCVVKVDTTESGVPLKMDMVAQYIKQ